MKYQTSQQGFTLIELMIVVSIIGILASIAIPAYRSHIIKSQWISGFTEISSGKIGASTGIGKMSTFDPSIVSAIGLIAHTVNCDITAANTVGVITILCAHKGHEGVDGKITTLSRAITEEWSCTSTVAQSIIGSANKCTGV